MSASDRPKPPRPLQPGGPDPDDPPTVEEQRAAEALRRALEDLRRPNGESGDRVSDAEARANAALAQSIRAASLPEALSAERHRQILDRALDPPQKARRTVAYIAFGGGAGLLAMAAAIALVIRGAAPEPAVSAKAAAEQSGPVLAFSRSTVELFPEGIPRSGGTSDRVDRIAYARAQDFRQNQFARWGAQ